MPGDDPLVLRLDELANRFWDLYEERHGVSMEFLTRDQVMQANDMVTEEVPVPEWGGKILVRTLTGIELNQFQQDSMAPKGSKKAADLHNSYARLIALCAIDAQGQRLFYPKDVELLGEKSAAALSRVAQVCMRINNLTQEDVEELAKN